VTHLTLNLLNFVLHEVCFSETAYIRDGTVTVTCSNPDCMQLSVTLMK